MAAEEPAAEKERVKRAIAGAFAKTPWPGGDDLCAGDGDEARLVKADFAGRKDWRMIPAELLDRSPGALGSALGVFSDQAFRFYLPAYLVADLDGLLKKADPVLHLTRGLDAATRGERVDAYGFGRRTWGDRARERFGALGDAEADAVREYLEHKARQAPADARLAEALDRYWRGRKLRPPPPPAAPKPMTPGQKAFAAVAMMNGASVLLALIDLFGAVGGRSGDDLMSYAWTAPLVASPLLFTAAYALILFGRPRHGLIAGALGAAVWAAGILVVMLVYSMR